MELQIIQKSKREIKGAKVQGFFVSLPKQFHTQIPHTVVGIDPGIRNLGVSIIYPNTYGDIDKAQTYHIYMPSIDKSRVVQGMGIFQSILASLCQYIIILGDDLDIIIEGAAYSMKGRQVTMAYYRATAALYFLKIGKEAKLVSPLTIRKGVFGSGKIKAKEEWTNIPGDASAALACALYATL